jgi:hypothetical protein
MDDTREYPFAREQVVHLRVAFEEFALYAGIVFKINEASSEHHTAEVSREYVMYSNTEREINKLTDVHINDERGWWEVYENRPGFEKVENT